MRVKAILTHAERVFRDARAIERRGEVARAEEFYTHAMKMGSLRAEKRLALMHRGAKIWYRASELEERGKISEAVKLYRQSARLGETGSMLNLANLLDDYAIPRKPREAIEWYKKAIKSGYSAAAFNLAMHYRNLGDHRWYAHWMRVAAKMGDHDAAKIVRKLDAKAKTSKSSPAY